MHTETAWDRRTYTRLTWAFFSIVVALSQTGCSRESWGGGMVGALGGAGATAAGYEIQARRQIEELDRQRNKGEISAEEYAIRKNQIESGSLVY